MKKVLLITLLLIAVFTVKAQTVFWQDDFENAATPDLPASSTRSPENNSGTGGPPNTSYFKRTNGTDIALTSAVYSGYSNTNFWAGEDHDTPFGAGNEEQQIEWTGINISGKTGLSFKGLFGANSTNGSWDNFTTGSAAGGYGVFASPSASNDYIIVEYAIDAGPYTQLIAFFGDDITGPIGTAKRLLEDTNGDFIGDGTVLTKAMTEFTKSISVTGTSMKLRIRVYSNGGNEEWGVDNFRITETAPCTNPSLPTLSTSPSTICSGTSSTLSVTAGNLNSATAWKWYTGSCGGTLVGTGTSITQSPSSTTIYYVRGEGGCVSPGACATVTVTVNSAPAAPGAVSGTTTICSGSSNTYSVAVVSGATSYNWTLPSGWTGSSSTNSISTTANTISGNVSVTATNSCGTSAASSQAITVNSPPVLNAETGATSVCETNSASFGVSASGSALTYQWMVSSDNGLTYSNVLAGVNYSNPNLSNLQISNTPYAFDQYLYKCKISGVCGPDIFSTESMLTVFPLPAFTSQPSMFSTCEHEPALFTVGAVSGMFYQWFENGNPLNDDATYSGAYSDSLVIDSVSQAMNGNIYTCQIFGLCSPPALSNGVSLTVYNGYNTNASATICSGTNYTFGSQTLTTSGAYSEVFHTINGCDSIVFLALTVNPVYHQSITAAICNGNSYSLGTQTLTASGNYTEVFQTVNGCDSVVDLNLTVNPVYHQSLSAAICNGSSYTLGTQTLTASGNYTEVFQSISGCDSIVDLILTVNPTYYQNISASICSGQTYVLGTQTLNANGNYAELFQSVSGCDSIVNLSLTVNTVDPTITQNQDTLMAITSGATYQWYNCNPASDPPISSIITGETNQLFIANTNGNYTLVVTLNGCVDTSTCNSVTTIGWNELHQDASVKLYPNPTGTFLNIEWILNEKFEYSIFNALGKVCIKGEASHNTVNVDTGVLLNGIYTVIMRAEGNTQIKKVIVNH